MGELVRWCSAGARTHGTPCQAERDGCAGRRAMSYEVSAFSISTPGTPPSEHRVHLRHGCCLLSASAACGDGLELRGTPDTGLSTG